MDSSTALASTRLGSGPMFDRIADRYDFVNRVLSLGLDLRWRKLATRALSLPPDARGEVLDLATGTGDLALTIAALHPTVSVLGTDPSENMLAVGQRKVIDRRLSARVRLTTGDAQAVEADDDRFLGATIAFGIRNVPDRLKALREMTRVVRSGGRVVVLEASASPTWGSSAPSRACTCATWSPGSVRCSPGRPSTATSRRRSRRSRRPRRSRT